MSHTKEVTKQAVVRSRVIDHQIGHDRDRQQREVQLLILGGAASGKSTFIKQLRIHYGDGFPLQERQRLKCDLVDNIIDAFHTVLHNISELGLNLTNSNIQDTIGKLSQQFPTQNDQTYFKPGHTSMDANLGQSPLIGRARPVISDIPPQFLELWKDQGFQHAFKLREKFVQPLTETEIHFLERFEEISSANYIPSVQDLLHVRKPTVGVQEHTFKVKEFLFRVIDVAGQKSQRKKWIHFFEGVTAVIFFVPLSGFNELLEEDFTINKLHDSLDLFNDVTHNKYLLRVDFILFLNKHDLFLQKLENGHSIRTAFPEYTGEDAVESSIKYIRNKFFKLAPSNKVIYPHVSCAIDINMMKVIIDDVLQIIMEINLKKAALI